MSVFNTFHLNELLLILVRYYTMITSYPWCKFYRVAFLVSAPRLLLAGCRCFNFVFFLYFYSNFIFFYSLNTLFTLIIRSQAEVARKKPWTHRKKTKWKFTFYVLSYVYLSMICLHILNKKPLQNSFIFFHFIFSWFRILLIFDYTTHIFWMKTLLA